MHYSRSISNGNTGTVTQNKGRWGFYECYVAGLITIKLRKIRKMRYGDDDGCGALSAHASDWHIDH
eukprot:1156309-Pelagomonas_calceolata.AAC.4